MTGSLAGYIGVFVLGTLFGITIAMFLVLDEQDKRIKRLPPYNRR